MFIEIQLTYDCIFNVRSIKANSMKELAPLEFIE